MGELQGGWLHVVARDMAYGVRLLRKSPGFAAASIAIVALGIGAVTAMFTIVYGVVLRPLPFPEPGRLVNLWTRDQRLGVRSGVNVADYNDWRASASVFEEIALFRNLANFNLTGDGEPLRLLGARVTANLFDVLQVRPALGRTFTSDENDIGREQVALLSDGLWRRRFGADPAIVGRSITLSGVPHLVVGVMPADFRFPSREFDIWTPSTFNPAEVSRQVPGYCCSAVARLARGVTLAAAQSEMDTVARRLADAYPSSNGQTRVELVPMRDELVQGVRPALYMLLGAVACLLIIASLNLSTLLSARAASRVREMSVRLSLGASHGRLALQAFAEVAPILVLGGALGIAFAHWAVWAFVPLAPAGLPRVDEVAVHLPVLAFSLMGLGLTGLIVGVLPAAQARRADLTAAARDDNRSTAGGRGQSRARRALVVAQVALSLPLLIGSGLLVRSLSALLTIEPGFSSERVITMHLAIPRSKYGGDRQIAAVTDRFLDRVHAVRGVTMAGMVNRLPLVRQLASSGGQLEIETGTGPNLELPSVDFRTVTPDYFRAMGISLVEGRSFTAGDTESAPLVGIVDERIARTVWPGQSAIGRRYRMASPNQPWVTIVGVVGHVQHDNLEDDGRPQVYWNQLQRAQDRMVLVARTTGDPDSVAPSIIAAIREIDPEQPVYDVAPMNDVVDRSLAQRWLNTVLLTGFAAAALLLTSLGLYGVMAFGVWRQSREFGIRLALGADRAEITRYVVRQGVTLAVCGAAIGLVVAALLTRGLSGMLYGVRAYDVASYTVATVVIFLVALTASYVPARRAAAVDPSTTLKAD